MLRALKRCCATSAPIAASSRETLLRAWDMGKAEGLCYVDCGNLPDIFREDTDCYRCGKTLIRRTGFFVESNWLEWTLPFM